MKILKLRFKNLNSLQGEWNIDFTDNAYLANGIFALTGPTGAGKSTILDAICLALYGRTPRLKVISQGSNEIMSRQTGECFAEVEFESQTGRFICHWSQHRAYKKPDGNLAAPAHEIADAVTGKIIENQRKVLPVVEKKTGMDFNRFIRSVMLAQGDFSLFLQSNANDRAPILEQITGTDIYSLISQTVYKRQSDENNWLENLKSEVSGIIFLSSEEEKQANEELTHKQNERNPLSELNAQINKAVQWLDGITVLRKEVAALTQETADIDEKIDTFKGSREKLRLADKAAELAGDHAALTTTRQQQSSDQHQFKSGEAKLPQLEKMLGENEKLLKAAEQHAATCKSAQKAETPLLQKVRALDLSASEKEKSIKAAEADVKKTDKQIDGARKSLSSAEKQHKTAQTESAKIQAWIATNASDEKLVSEYSAIATLINNLESVLADRTSARNILEEEQKQVKKLVSTFKAHEKDCQKAVGEHENTQNVLTKLQEKLVNLLDGAPLRKYRTERDNLLQQKFQLEKFASFEEERKNLVAGHPCPLCGATEHPLATGNTEAIEKVSKETTLLEKLINKAEELEVQIAKAQANEKSALEKRSEIEKKFTKAGHDKESSDKNIKKLEKDFSSASSKLETARAATLEKLKVHGIHKLPEENIEKILSDLNSRLQEWQKQQTRKNEIETQLHQFSAEIKEHNSIITTLENTLNDRKKMLTEQKNAWSQIVSERKQLYADKKPDEEEARLEIQTEQAEKNEKQAREKHDQASRNLNELKTQIKSLGESIARRSVELEALVKCFTLNLARKNFADETTFIACHLPSEQREELKAQAETLDRKKSETAARRADRENTLEKELAKKLTEDSPDSLKQKQAENETKLKSLDEEIGAFRQKLSENEKAKALISDKQQLITAQKNECQKWNQLNELIGSASGNKYRNFAQGLTFEVMVQLANEQLRQMTDRYILVRDAKEHLDLNVIDNWQASKSRSTKNLSGGESFIVSLALALGLSKMASKKVRIDSLFLDEGFGTLDEDALETALEALSALQQTGKLIGVISHVPALKERISTQIEVKPIAGGRSSISGPGVSRKV